MIQRLYRNVTVRAALLCACVLTLSAMRPGVSPADPVIADIERSIAAGDPVTLDWKAMAALNYRTGEMPESLRKLNGVVVRIPGFMVPLEDTETRVTEFLLVPYFGACIHTPPPPPNQMVHVLMQRKQTVDVNLWDPIWIVGTLKIESVESPYGMVGFQLTGERILPYDG
ncbi:MAG TPA: DUF3299 domain-containing protein [Longimicrobiales bacterium]